MSTGRRSLLKFASVAVVAPCLTMGWGTAWAQSSKPITLVVGYAPGGLSDLMGRLFAAEFSKTVGRQVVVENRPGANGNIATTAVANGSKDGDILLFASGAQMVLNPNVYPSLQVKPMVDLTPVGMVGQGDFIVATNTSLGVKSMTEFIELAKSKPGQMNYGTPGLGSFGHVLSELIKERTRINVKAVHYRGAALMLPELMANQVQFVVEGPTLLKENIAAGKLRGLMVLGSQRSKLVPDVPTSSELGLKGLEGISNWFGVMAPKGLAAPTLASYRAALQKVTASPEFAAKLEANGMSSAATTPEEFSKKIANETQLFKQVAKTANIVAE
ncbi:tripartite tricarboxylate transporter substrate binding protein [Cupriavidus sp. amp6]|uniref:Bug family tripartite tricarboxylate transporter substrate binding protein n=1 Tax=Cupriavidus sp. amp6 TaxID=388051 RepID=UPI00068432BD|nr:tripartite tricarboxylate transporter substrate binding protein [Cupriavidus sp. amp6]